MSRSLTAAISNFVAGPVLSASGQVTVQHGPVFTIGGNIGRIDARQPEAADQHYHQYDDAEKCLHNTQSPKLALTIIRCRRVSKLNSDGVEGKPHI